MVMGYLLAVVAEQGTLRRMAVDLADEGLVHAEIEDPRLGMGLGLEHLDGGLVFPQQYADPAFRVA
ncbi:hypothetical protein D3C79_951690 [compost metagenome]